MAARLHPRHQDEIRQKIQASVLVTMLQRLAEKGEIQVAKDAKKGGSMWRAATPADAPLVGLRVKAALGLLAKTVPDLSTVEWTGPGGGAVQFERIERVIVDPKK